mmetsp:Transcript_3916/g.24779  ORF Transcript_3916/g.24779 Transcript_3916/m.24779 type:complete len:202 (-) Transcript_3916:28-633(-)
MSAATISSLPFPSSSPSICDALPASRTSARTSRPWASSLATTRLPTPPVAPGTSTTPRKPAGTSMLASFVSFVRLLRSSSPPSTRSTISRTVGGRLKYSTVDKNRPTSQLCFFVLPSPSLARHVVVHVAARRRFGHDATPRPRASHVDVRTCVARNIPSAPPPPSSIPNQPTTTTRAAARAARAEETWPRQDTKEGLLKRV